MNCLRTLNFFSLPLLHVFKSRYGRATSLGFPFYFQLFLFNYFPTNFFILDFFLSPKILLKIADKNRFTHKKLCYECVCSYIRFWEFAWIERINISISSRKNLGKTFVPSFLVWTFTIIISYRNIFIWRTPSIYLIVLGFVKW